MSFSRKSAETIIEKQDERSALRLKGVGYLLNGVGVGYITQRYLLFECSPKVQKVLFPVIVVCASFSLYSFLTSGKMWIRSVALTQEIRNEVKWG